MKNMTLYLFEYNTFIAMSTCKKTSHAFILTKPRVMVEEFVH